MRELYERLIEEGEAGIQRLIDERMQEGVQLDFKQKGDPRRGTFDNNDRKILAKAVSGFANSAGGLLIWGVNAEKGQDGIDCAQAPAAPISQIELFLSEATTLVGQLVQPRHDGVHLHAVHSVAVPDAGYLLMYIARSDRRPHRSEASGQKQYFKRAGDSFFEMEHYDIEDAFSRISTPTVEIRHVIRFHMGSGNNRDYNIDLYMKNTSDFIAKYPYVVFDVLSGCNIAPYPDDQPLRLERGVNTISLTGGTDDVIHPHTEKHVAGLRASFVRISDKIWVMPLTNRNIQVSFRCLFGCEGSRPLRLEVALNDLAFNLGP